MKSFRAPTLTLSARRARYINAVAAPTLGPIIAGETPLDALSANALQASNYTTDAAGGSIVDPPTGLFSVDGAKYSEAAGSQVIEEFQSVDVLVLVADTLGNSETFYAGGVEISGDAPALSGTTLSDVSVLNGVSIDPIDTSAMFTGFGLTYEIRDGNLPAGLSFNPTTGVIFGRTDNPTDPANPPLIVVRAVNPSGVSVTEETGFVLESTGPEITFEAVGSSSLELSTNDAAGTYHWAFCSTLPSRADLIDGEGAGILISDSFDASVSGLTPYDLSSEAGTPGLMLVIQIGTGGAMSAIISEELTPQAVTVNLVDPDLTDAEWSPTGITVTGGQTDASGGSGAYLLENTATNAGLGQATDLLIAGTHRLRLKVKAGPSGHNFFRVAFDSASSWFRLDTVAVTTQNHAVCTITDIGGGWRQITITHSASSPANLALIVPAGSGNLAEVVGHNVYVDDVELSAA